MLSSRDYRPFEVNLSQVRASCTIFWPLLIVVRFSYRVFVTLSRSLLPHAITHRCWFSSQCRQNPPFSICLASSVYLEAVGTSRLGYRRRYWLRSTSWHPRRPVSAFQFALPPSFIRHGSSLCPLALTGSHLTEEMKPI